MRDIKTDGELTLTSSGIKPVLSASTPITSTIREWDLAQIETILTVDSLEDDNARKRAIHKRRRNSNVLLGGMIGGLIDADTGYDDSIVDGVLLGAAFGAICTSSPEEPKAQVGLVFRDGSHLAVEVSKDEYTQLQTLASGSQQAVGDVQSAVSDRMLNSSEINNILSDRANNSFKRRIFAAILIAATPTASNLFFSNMTPEFSLPETLSIVLQYICIIGALFVCIASVFSILRPESFLTGGEEQEFSRTRNN